MTRFADAFASSSASAANRSPTVPAPANNASIFRRGDHQRETKKRQPPIRLPGHIDGSGLRHDQIKCCSIAHFAVRVLRGSRLPMAHLNGAGDQNLVVNASAFAACPTADAGFVHLDMLVRAATDAILVRADHSGAQFVEDLKGCLVTRERELWLRSMTVPTVSPV